MSRTECYRHSLYIFVSKIPWACCIVKATSRDETSIEVKDELTSGSNAQQKPCRSQLVVKSPDWQEVVDGGLAALKMTSPLQTRRKPHPRCPEYPNLITHHLTRVRSIVEWLTALLVLRKSRTGDYELKILLYSSSCLPFHKSILGTLCPASSGAINQTFSRAFLTVF